MDLVRLGDLPYISKLRSLLIGRQEQDFLRCKKKICGHEGTKELAIQRDITGWVMVKKKQVHLNNPVRKRMKGKKRRVICPSLLRAQETKDMGKPR